MSQALLSTIVFSSGVCIKTRSPPALLSFKGQVTEQTTVKWSIKDFVVPYDPNCMPYWAHLFVN